jgi:HNH endonuclease/AP2 domain
MNIDVLKSLLRYDPETGLIYWIAKGKGKIKKKAAGTLLHSGYLGICIGLKRWQAHRIAWALHHGDWPKDQVDHINGVKIDNRACNLREATNSQNGKNLKLSKANKTGIAGVCWNKKHQSYRAYIKVEHKAMYLGTYKNLDDAAKARRNAEDKYFGEWKRNKT